MQKAVEPTQYLVFQLAGEDYGICILEVKEIIEYCTPTKIPQTPPFVRGVTNLRGTVVPVIDLAQKFGLPVSPITIRTCIIVLEMHFEGQPILMGIVADGVSKVISLSPEAILPAPVFGTTVRVDFLLGVGKSDKFVLLLDIHKSLAEAELQTHVTPQVASGDL